MIIESTRLGTLDIPEEEIISFPEGLPGFPGEKGFVLITPEAESPFSFLQSTQEPNLCFIIIDPFAFFPDYEFNIEDDMALEWGLSKDNPPQIFVIATIRENIANMTVNLAAPLIINPRKKSGRQLILNSTKYSIRQRLFPEGLVKEAGKGGK